MKRTEVKTILKPLIKQCVREALLEEGILSGVVSEVVKGFTPLLTENVVPKESTAEDKQKQKLVEENRRAIEEAKYQRIKEQKIKMLNATGFGQEIFDGVEPLSAAGPDSGANPGPLAGTRPNDAGVDISGIMAIGGNKWKNLI